MNAIELTLKINSVNAVKNLADVKAKIAELRTEQINPLDEKAVKKAGDALASSFANGKNAAQELLSRQQQIVASMALAGQAGSKEFKAAQGELVNAKKAADEFEKAMQKAMTPEKSSASARLAQFGLMTQGVQQISNSLNELAAPFIKYEATLADFSALTGVSGEALDMFGAKAKELAATFGGSASGQIEAFKGILSRLGPDIAKSPEALEKMSLAVNTLSKASGLDTTSSMQALTTSVLQFDVSLDNPISAANEMTRMMNVLAAGAKEGAAEIPQVSEAVTAAGVAMSGAKISFEEGNAAIQVLASGGKYGAEAGTALRNVLGLLQKASGPAESALKGMGLSSKELAKTLTTQGLESAIKQLSGGMNTLSSDAAKNAALMEIFGMENASAAGILIKKADQIGTLKDKITGTDTAFAQANINMNTTAASMDRFKARIENIFISVFSVLGSGVSTAVGSLSSLQAPITAIAGIKSIIPEGSGEKLKDLGVSALNAAKGLTLQSISTGIMSGATTVLTAAQSALNAVFIASPIGWIVLGIAGAAAAMYLLYQNVEPVRDAFDKAWIIIKSGALAVWEILKGVGTGIVKLFSGDFAGAAEAFGSLGTNASAAFSDSLNKGLNNLQFDNAAKKATEAMQKGSEINLKINSQEALAGYVKDYEATQNKINELKAKKASGTATLEEQKDLEVLGMKAQETALKIGKIAPETKENFKTIVDASGNIKEVWDINIKKAQEFTSTQKNNGDLKTAAAEYSSALMNQVGVISNQIERQKALKTQIEQTNDPAAKQKLIDKYNEENKAIDATKQKVIANFQEGAKAGLLTSQAFDELGKQLGITGDQARKMALSKELEETAKKGVVTDSQIQKIADKYGVTFEKAKEITIEQKKITDETEKTKLSAMGWGEAVSEIKKAQEKAVTAVKDAKIAYKEGRISAQELKDIEAASVAEVQKRNAEMKTHNQITKEVSAVKGLQIVQEETAAKNEKAAAKERETAYNAAKRLFEQSSKDSEEKRKQADIDAKIAIAKEGRALTAKESFAEELKTNTELSDRYKSQIADAENLLSLAEKTKGAKSKAEDVKDATARLNDLETKAKELELKDLTLKIKIASDDEKNAKELEKLKAAADKAEIEYKVKIGALPESASVKFAIQEINRQIADAESELKKPEISIDTVKSEELKNKITSLNYDLASENSKLDFQSAQEKINLIQNTAERERELSILNAQAAYNKDLQLAGDNNAAKLAAYQKFNDEKIKADQDYLIKEKPLYVAAGEAITEFSKNVSFDFKKPDNSAAEAVQKDITKLKAQYAQGKIQANEYYNQLDELEKKLQDSQVKRQSAFLQGINKGLSAAASAFQKTSSKMLTDSMENYSKVSAAGGDTTKAMDAVMSASVANIAVSGAQALASGKNIAKAMIATAFDMLQAMVPIWTAQITGFSLASAESVATFGIAGLAKALAITAMLTLAIQGAKAAVGGFFHGGYTGKGNPHDVAGVVHYEETVATAEASKIGQNREIVELMNTGVDVGALIYENAVVSMNLVNDFSKLEKAIAETNNNVANAVNGMREDFKKLQFERKSKSEMLIKNVIEINDKKFVKEAARTKRMVLKHG